MPRGLASVVGVALLATSGCGGATVPAADDVPALAARLEKVENAVAAERYAAARTALQALVAETTDARDEGDLSDDQADPILTSAEALLAALPGTAEPPPEPESPLATVPIEPEPEVTADPPDEEEPDKSDNPDKPEKPEKPDKPDKEDKKDKDDDEDDD